jgi:hypothetical protein
MSSQHIDLRLLDATLVDDLVSLRAQLTGSYNNHIVSDS